jgi:Flp pilus assembly protein TadD
MSLKRRRRPVERPRLASEAPKSLLPLTGCGIIILVIAIAYANALSAPLIYDDAAVVRDNPTIRQLWPLTHPLSPPPTGTPISGRPIANLTFAINYALGGLSPRGYHVVNIAIHTGCALLMFGIIRRTLDSYLAQPASAATALLATALWAVHPLNTEAVTHISARTESLMAFCFLLTLYAGVRAANSTGSWWASICVVASAAGMACKESMVVAPIMVALYDGIFRADSWHHTLRARRWLYAGLFSTWAVLVYLNWSWPRGHSAGFVADAGLFAPTSPFDYLLNQALLIPRYVRLAVWPKDLVFDYGMVRPLRLADVAGHGLVILTAVGLACALLVRRPRWGFLGAWFFVTLAPASSIVPIFSEVGAERRMYLPLMALTTAVALTLYAISRRAKRGVVAASTLVAVALVAALTAATISRNAEYTSDLTLWRTVVERWPHGRARYNLAMALEADGRLNDAETELRAAARDYPEALSVLGIELLDQGRIDEGIEQLRTFLRLRPAHINVVVAHGRLADALFSQRRYAEAIPEYRAFLEIRPQFASAWTNLGISLAATEASADAVTAFRRALALSSNSSDAHRNLANALLETHDYREAVEHAREALRISPHDSVAREILSLAEGLRTKD